MVGFDSSEVSDMLVMAPAVVVSTRELNVFALKVSSELGEGILESEGFR